MRRRAKIDANHAQIVKALRNAGASVQSLATIGCGCPDLLVGFKGKNFLMEIKDPMQPPNKRKLTEDERAWHGAWMGALFVIESEAQAFDALGIAYIYKVKEEKCS